MKAGLKILGLLLVMIGGDVLFSSFMAGMRPPPVYTGAGSSSAHKFPYRQAGLTDKQAAAHLLSRFTYGAKPGQIEEVARMGLENWFAQQLQANLSDPSLDSMLAPYDALKYSNQQIVDVFPNRGRVIRMAVKDSVVNKDSVREDRVAFRDVIKAYMDKKGYRPEQELYRQFVNQKILRAAYSENQLQEVMTDFWFNHFNVSITKNDCAQFIPDYERDVIRPNALGKFGELLLKTAQSPAMLYYLDNFSSSAPPPEGKMGGGKNRAGINENYAREVMELHTLGVDGGYTQQDVTQAARVLTGWGVYPMGEAGKGIVEKFSEEQLAQKGFVHNGDFFFNINRHDKGDKVVLGHAFPAGGGYQEGVDLLDMLAHHPSTAKFICRKLAVRFVSDNPPPALIDKMAKTFAAKNGDIREVLITMVSSPDFWSASAVREKTKTPTELCIGAIRSLDATVDQPYQLYNWITRMGEKKYYYQAPTGFPDKGAYWINTGSLLNRMNFGLAIAGGRIPGVHFNLVALNDGHEPESAQAALATYGRIILPERDLDGTIKRLTPMLNDPGLAKKIDDASNRAVRSEDALAMNDGRLRTRTEMTAAADMGQPMLAQVVGIIIGSPEYQRR